MNKTVLVANRGEIACRIIRSCRELGLRSVAVYSDADRDALHVQSADEAVHIGPAPARESYLRSELILEAARKTNANLVHPGYGFLAENADFARTVMQQGLQWVGPSPEAILAMGDKERAREIARAAGVPVLPGTSRLTAGIALDFQPLVDEIGFPLLVKAAAGGGGIGMRRVDDAAQLESVIEATQSMAEKAFGDGGVYLERLVSSARHIEVQVFGFGDGRGVHLFDRDCSVQRRFQKVIEEAPAPGLPADVRETLHRAALALVHEQKYAGAGTVEFIYDLEREQAYFLEMNTRIQVEHPATEVITGIDLVAWQLRQALGELQGSSQERITQSGHALECRVYAERPEKGFLPSPGAIAELDWPEERSWLRIDTGVRAGDKVTPYYDPMIAKLIVRGEDRPEAIARMDEALGQMTLTGVSTNVAFLRDVLADSVFQKGGMDTGFVSAHMSRR